MARMAAFVAAAASLVLLAGCAPTPRPTPLTAAEVAAFEAQLYDQVWQETGLDDDLRPATELGEYVPMEELPELVSTCMAGASQADLDTGLAYYRCLLLYPVSPREQGYFSAAERRELYDYFQKSLIPCLEVHGYHVASAPPRFAADRPGRMDWHPVWTLAEENQDVNWNDTGCDLMPDWAGGR